MIDKIAIHTCCADCLLNLVHFLEEEKQIDSSTEIHLIFYNPNIHPRSEYLERLNALKSVVQNTYAGRKIKLVIPEYRPVEYFQSIKGKERRCLGCWELRLGNVFEYAKAHDISYISSTLLSSHYQDKQAIINIAKNLEDNNIQAIYPKEEHEHLCNRGFYKQNFCGCCYSLNERLWEKYVKE